MSAVSRRTVIAGIATGVATGITPTVMANPVEFEGPAERVNRLAQELSEALADWAGGSFRAIVEPDDPDRAGVWLQNMHVGPGRKQQSNSDDPIFAAIDAHRVAYERVNAPGESSVEVDCQLMDAADSALLSSPLETHCGAHALMQVLRAHHLANYGDDGMVDALLVGLMDKVIGRLAI